MYHIEFRPSNLVGCLCNILRKVLADRLGIVTSGLIGDTQFAFLPSRQPHDCSLVANEVVDYMRRKKSKGIIFKVDFKKDYDIVDWSFLVWVLRRKGFDDRWRSWIKSCVSSASVFVLVNG